MTLKLSVLGSGSRGNATAIATSTHDGIILIDAGLSLRETDRRLRTLGRTIDDVRHIVITHFDRDHYQPVWNRRAIEHGITIHCATAHIACHPASPGARPEVHAFERIFSLGDVKFDPIHFAHDDVGVTGFVLECGRIRFGYATDLGRVPPVLYERFIDLDGVAIESNYDVQMQQASGRPEFLKRRIMGGRGHLSNDECLAALRRIGARSHLREVILLHLSQQCNDPALVERLYQTTRPEGLPQPMLSNQHTPTGWIHLDSSVVPQRAPQSLFAGLHS